MQNIQKHSSSWKIYEQLTYLICSQTYVTLKTALRLLEEGEATSWRIRNKVDEMVKITRYAQNNKNRECKIKEFVLYVAIPVGIAVIGIIVIELIYRIQQLTKKIIGNKNGMGKY